MLLEKLTIENLGVFGGKCEFDLRTEPSRPIILCGGDNGSGKTTIFESIMMCLYGKKYLGVSEKKYQDIISRLFHDNDGVRSAAMSVSLEFKHVRSGKATRYAVSRVWERGSDGTPLESLVVRVKDEGGVDTRTSDDQSVVDGILPLGVARLFFFDGEEIQRMAEDNDESAYIRTSLDALFGLDVAKQLYQDIGIHMDRNSDSEVATITDEIQYESGKKKNLEEKLDRAREDQVFKASELDGIRDELLHLEERFARLGGKFAEKRTKLVDEKGRLEREIDGIRREISDMCSGLLPLCMVREQMASIKRGLDSDIKTMHGISERQILSEAFSYMAARAKSEFGTGKVTKRLKAIMSERLDEIPGKQDTAFGLSANDTESIIGLMDSADLLDLGRLEKLCSDLKAAGESLKEIDASVGLAPQQDEIGPLFSKILQVGKDLKDTEDEIENLKNMESQYRSELILVNSNIRKLLGKKRKCVKKMDGLDLAPRIQEALQEYSDALRVEKSMALASNILDAVRRLLHKEDFVASVRVNPDTFEVSMHDKNGDEITRDKLSRGELQIYATAVMWGTAKTSGRAMPLVIDTPLARLDSSHRSNMVEGFYPDASHQTIILSTDSEITREHFSSLRQHVARSMVVQHENGRSVISEGYFWRELVEV